MQKLRLLGTSWQLTIKLLNSIFDLQHLPSVHFLNEGDLKAPAIKACNIFSTPVFESNPLNFDIEKIF